MQSNMVIPSDQDWYFSGNLGAKNIRYPDGQITDAAVNAAAGIKATKLIHQHAIRYYQPAGSDVAAATVPIHTFRGDAEIVAAEVVPLTAPAGGDKAFGVDVRKGNQSTAFASVLSAAIAVNNTKADREVCPGTVTTDTAADGDTLEAVVTVSGSTGSQGQGFVLTVWVREEP